MSDTNDYNKQRNKEIEEKGFLPVNEEYSETMSSPMEEVEKNPKRYIIEECIPACQILWDKNIYTFMVSDHLNEGETWIEVPLDALSEENKNVILSLSGEDIIKCPYHKGCIYFGVNYIGKKAQDRLIEIANMFEMQDVQKGLAYITIPEFLMNYCNCYDEVNNPEYYPLEESPELISTFEGLNKYNEWLNSIHSRKTIRKYNPNKLDKPIENYLQENNMIMDGDKIYLSGYHYDKHLKYLKYIENQKTSVPNIK